MVRNTYFYRHYTIRIFQLYIEQVFSNTKFRQIQGGISDETRFP